MGSGLVQVGVLLAATVIGLPCFFFTLLALLDHFEQRLTDGAPALTAAAVPAQIIQVVQTAGAAIERVLDGAGSGTDPDRVSDSEPIGADVVELPTPFTPSSAPAAATG